MFVFDFAGNCVFFRNGRWPMISHRDLNMRCQVSMSRRRGRIMYRTYGRVIVGRPRVGDMVIGYSRAGVVEKLMVMVNGCDTLAMKHSVFVPGSIVAMQGGWFTGLERDGVLETYRELVQAVVCRRRA